MPIVILREQPGVSLDPRLEVVDGQQRLTTLLSFISPEAFPQSNRFSLLEKHRGDLDCETFAEMSDEMKNQLLSYEIAVHILPPSISDRTVLDIFARLNATGYKLNNQELRNAEFQGSFKEYAYTVANDLYTSWTKWGLFTNDNLARMAEVEYVSDLTLNLIYGVSAVDKDRLDRLYRENEAKFLQEDDCTYRLKVVLDTLDSNFGDKVKNSPFSKKTWFHALFMVLHHVMFAGTKAGEHKREAVPVPKHFWSRLEQTAEVIANGVGLPEHIAKSVRTTNQDTRIHRFEYLLRELLDEDEIRVAAQGTV